MALVIKQWECGREANEQGNYVHLVGREGGLISWLLSLIGIDPVSEVEVKEDLIKFTSSSLAGKVIRIIPVKSLTSAYYSYEKPWKIAVGIFIVGFFLMPYYFLGLLVWIAGAAYYVLNKNLAVAVVEASGWSGVFAFKRSIIEGQNIDEEAGYEVIDVIRQRIEAKLS
jgi:hypothetical protein